MKKIGILLIILIMFTIGSVYAYDDCNYPEGPYDYEVKVLHVEGKSYSKTQVKLEEELQKFLDDKGITVKELSYSSTIYPGAIPTYFQSVIIVYTYEPYYGI